MPSPTGYCYPFLVDTPQAGEPTSNASKIIVRAAMVKYSIIVPVYNGGHYLPACVQTILSQNYTDFELIISDDHSTDGSSDYLKSLEHSRVRTLSAPHTMSMAEHWEWALSHAQGEWLIFVGQDDGLQLYFFELADILTQYAERHNIRAINSTRAYYFWPGYEHVFGDSHVAYEASPSIEVCNSKWKCFQALTGITDYLELPQMYTNSLFHKSLLDEARTKQQGKVFVTHPQDANLAAIACSLESRYLRSTIPLVWVGTSPKSAGMAIGEQASELRSVYLDKIRSSKLDYCPLIGPFSLNSFTLYFWGALVQTKSLQSTFFNAMIKSKLMRYAIFLASRFELSRQTITNDELVNLQWIYSKNSCSEKVLNKIYFLYKLYRKFFFYCIKKRKIFFKTEKYRMRINQNERVELIDISKIIKDKVQDMISVLNEKASFSFQKNMQK